MYNIIFILPLLLRHRWSHQWNKAADPSSGHHLRLRSAPWKIQGMFADLTGNPKPPSVCFLVPMDFPISNPFNPWIMSYRFFKLRYPNIKIIYIYKQCVYIYIYVCVCVIYIYTCKRSALLDHLVKWQAWFMFFSQMMRITFGLSRAVSWRQTPTCRGCFSLQLWWLHDVSWFQSPMNNRYRCYT